MPSTSQPRYRKQPFSISTCCRLQLSTSISPPRHPSDKLTTPPGRKGCRMNRPASSLERSAIKSPRLSTRHVASAPVPSSGFTIQPWREFLKSSMPAAVKETAGKARITTRRARGLSPVNPQDLAIEILAGNLRSRLITRSMLSRFGEILDKAPQHQVTFGPERALHDPPRHAAVGYEFTNE
jgi:hypothetical protein